MSDVEAGLQTLIKAKRRRLDQINERIERLTKEGDSLHNLIVELEGLFPREASGSDDQPLVHNHDLDPSCPELRMLDGTKRGRCVEPHLFDAMDSSADRFRA